MNGKWVSVKPWMVQKSKQVTIPKMIPKSAPVCEGKMLKAYRSAIVVQPKDTYDYSVSVPVGCKSLPAVSCCYVKCLIEVNFLVVQVSFIGSGIWRSRTRTLDLS
jgi:hypothetical protein